jgi:thiamine biosynthesis lipoprotein
VAARHEVKNYSTLTADYITTGISVNKSGAGERKFPFPGPVRRGYSQRQQIRYGNLAARAIGDERNGTMRKNQSISAALVLILVVLVGIGLWQTAGRRRVNPIVVVRRPPQVMGTACTLAAAVARSDRATAEEALREAERLLRDVEAKMSVWLTDSEISRLNAAAAAQERSLSPPCLDVLRAAKQAAADTQGAFDVTCRPLIALWQQAGRQDRLPTDRQRNAARDASNWKLLELTDTGALKHAAGASVDLGGIAKGYAIDGALRILEQAGVDGAMVDVGGDVACLGRAPDGHEWSVDVKSPFGPAVLARLHVAAGAVATSGNYARYRQIAGRRYSHIIDPRTGRPAEAAESVTVVAPTAMAADVWATALSVLGPDGFGQLPGGFEALMVLGSAEDYQMLSTAGFRELLQEPLPKPLTVYEPNH